MLARVFHDASLKAGLKDARIAQVLPWALQVEVPPRLREPNLAKTDGFSRKAKTSSRLGVAGFSPGRWTHILGEFTAAGSVADTSVGIELAASREDPIVVRSTRHREECRS